MEAGVKLPTNIPETQRTYRIEHLPGLDVVVNLGYPNQENQNTILDMLRKNELGNNLTEEQLLNKIGDENNNPRFFLKYKIGSKEMIDFIKGRIPRDVLKPIWNKNARYAFAGVLNEIILSKKIKEIIASNAVQELGQRYGFVEIKFAEPIVAIIFNKSNEKYLAYENFVEVSSFYYERYEEGEEEKIIVLTEELRGIFLNNGVIPNDLRTEQFMICQKPTGRYLVLIDIEAYTQTDKPTS